MTRISLKEAYDNRDVIAWLVKHEDEINELMNILKDIDPSGDLTNVVTKTGDQTIDGIKTFIGKIVADCDIIQNGGNYETHAEQVFTTNDYIVMRDGAVSGLGTGQFSGFQVKKYDGADDGRLVIDSSGIARVGDVGDEQPLATRDEAADMTSGALVKWDNVNQKMIAPASNIGSDTKPVKIVGGIPVPVSEDLTTKTATANLFLPASFSYPSANTWQDLNLSGNTVTTDDATVFEEYNHAIRVKKTGHYAVRLIAATGNGYQGIKCGNDIYQNTVTDSQIVALTKLNSGAVIVPSFYSGAAGTKTVQNYNRLNCLQVLYIG